MARDPYRLVYRTFDDVQFDPAKSEAIYEERGFDLNFIAGVFPGWVAERQDPRDYGEVRYQILGERHDVLYCIVYTLRGRVCRLVTAWEANRDDERDWRDLNR